MKVNLPSMVLECALQLSLLQHKAAFDGNETELFILSSIKGV